MDNMKHLLVLRKRGWVEARNLAYGDERSHCISCDQRRDTLSRPFASQRYTASLRSSKCPLSAKSGQSKKLDCARPDRGNPPTSLLPGPAAENHLPETGCGGLPALLGQTIVERFDIDLCLGRNTMPQ